MTGSARDDDVWTRLRAARIRATGTVFGDRGGLVVFLSAALFLGALWRVGIFVADSTTIANAVANVAEGRLAVVDTPYALTASGQPGLVEVDGQLFARNYGQVYLAAALYWVLAVATAAVPLSVLLLGAWCLGLVALSRSAADLLERPRLETGGSLLAVAVLAGSLPVLTAIPPDRGPLVALQLVTLLGTAAAGLLAYRILAYFHGRRVGMVAGGLVVLATPLGFWGSLPKRHVFTAALILAAVYCFAASRRKHRPAVRAAGYASIGLLASVHAFEAAFLLVAFAPVELATAPRNDRRTLAVVGAVFLLSAGPMLATNAAISGNPLAPPRLLSDASAGGFPADPGGAAGASGADESPGTVEASDGGSAESAPPGDDGAGGGPGADSDGGGDGGSGGAATPTDWLGPLRQALAQLSFVLGFMADSVVAGLAAATEPERLYHVLVRSGWNPFVKYTVTDFEAVDLALLEVLPLAGALAYLPVAAGRRLRDGFAAVADSLRDALATPVGQTDLLVGVVALTFTVVYLPRLPLHSQLTLRYVVPVMALLVYGVVRLAPVRRAIGDAPRVLAAGSLLAVIVAFLGLSLAGLALDLAIGEAVQLQALAGLATALLAAVAIATWPLHEEPGAVALGVAAAAGTTTAFLALSALVYFPYGPYALDAVRVLADLLPAVA